MDRRLYLWLTCDEDFGRDSDFLDQVSAYVWYLVEVSVDTAVWWERPMTTLPPWSGKGRKPVREKLVEGEPTAQTVAALISTLSPEQWSRQLIQEGSKAPHLTLPQAILLLKAVLPQPKFDLQTTVDSDNS